jgi:hypothetical protein
MVVDMVPAMGPVYEMIGLELPLGEGLEINDVAPERGSEAGVDFIIVRGKITNITGSEKCVPLIKALLVDADGEEIQSVVQEPSAPMISGGEVQTFAVKIEEPSPLARSMEVTFVGRPNKM